MPRKARRGTAQRARKESEEQQLSMMKSFIDLDIGSDGQPTLPFYSLAPEIAGLAATMLLKHGSRKQSVVWHVDQALSLYGFTDNSGRHVGPEPDTNFRMMYVPAHPTQIEQIYGLTPFSTTNYVNVQGWIGEKYDQFLPTTAPNVLRPHRPNDNADFDCTRSPSDKDFVRDLVQRIDAYCARMDALFVKTLAPSNQNSLMMQYRPPSGLAVRALLLGMVASAPSSDLRDILKPAVMMLIAVYQHDEVSYSDMLAAAYMLAYIIYVNPGNFEPLMEHLVTLPYIRLPLATRMGVIRGVVGGQLSQLNW